MLEGFLTHLDDAGWCIYACDAPAVTIRAQSEDDARRLCDAANAGYRLGFSVGEQSAMTLVRRAIGILD